MTAGGKRESEVSTRCQVRVEDGQDWSVVTLYHHCDGYPEAMLPVIRHAWENACKVDAARRASWGGTVDGPPWESGRAGKAAAMLCAGDPLGFEVEQGNDLHGDIEWLYRIDTRGGKWTVGVYRRAGDWSVTPTLSSVERVGEWVASEPLTDAVRKTIGCEEWCEVTA